MFFASRLSVFPFHFVIVIQVIPPGMEFDHIVVHDGEVDGDLEENEDNPASPDPPIWSEVLIIFSCAMHDLLISIYIF